MLTIRCSHRRKKLILYYKIGEGRLIRCWKNHIKENHTSQNNFLIKCECGQIIGKDEGTAIKLRLSSILISGKTNK